MTCKILIFLILNLLLLNCNTAIVEEKSEIIHNNYLLSDLNHDGIMDSVLCHEFIWLDKSVEQGHYFSGGKIGSFISKSKFEKYRNHINGNNYWIMEDEKFNKFKELLLSMNLPEADVKIIHEILQIHFYADNCNLMVMNLDYKKYELKMEEIVNQVFDGIDRLYILCFLADPWGAIDPECLREINNNKSKK